jgi:hypothetical protein
MANNLNNSQHAHFTQDMACIERALVWFRDHFKDKPSKMSDMLGDICAEAVEIMKRRRTDDIATASGEIWLAEFLDGRGNIW